MPKENLVRYSCPPDRKECTSCGMEKSRDKAFHKDPSKPDGLHDMCKKCRAAAEKETHLKELDERIKMIDEGSLRVLSQLANKAQVSIGMPHLATLFEDCMTIFGGSQGFAQHLLAQYLSAKPGGTTRLRIAEAMMRMAAACSIQGYVERPLGTLTDDELQKLQDEKIRRVKEQLRLTDGRDLREPGSSAAG